jgi:hypothetical protein
MADNVAQVAQVAQVVEDNARHNYIRRYISAQAQFSSLSAPFAEVNTIASTL